MSLTIDYEACFGSLGGPPATLRVLPSELVNHGESLENLQDKLFIPYSTGSVFPETQPEFFRAAFDTLAQEFMVRDSTTFEAFSEARIGFVADVDRRIP